MAGTAGEGIAEAVWDGMSEAVGMWLAGAAWKSASGKENGGGEVEREWSVIGPSRTWVPSSSSAGKAKCFQK